ncbi:DUF1330 domain-containing protein [Nocardia donostiensis]|uniref:DUF1330 domain-containing protein n=1 Tax=Nocardia donostiensis TaxID=1538463 RepID=UPI001C3764DB
MGRPGVTWILIIEFPGMARIRQWYDSPEYRRAPGDPGRQGVGADAVRRGSAARGLLGLVLTTPSIPATARGHPDSRLTTCRDNTLESPYTP